MAEGSGREERGVVQRGTVQRGGATLLSNGRYGVLLTAGGGGYSAFAGRALTRWAPDPTRELGGLSLFVRDLESGAYWTAGRQPVPGAAVRDEVRFAPGRAELVREVAGIALRLELCVAPYADVELRRITLTNQTGRIRRLDLTTYAELVLNQAAADAAHPAFSKLFVQTAFDPALEMLFAWRRPRSPDEEPLWLAHMLQLEEGDQAEDLEFETDRASFLGRGRTPAEPHALDRGVRLSGTLGNVLDPIAALRRGVILAPGASVRAVALLGAGRSRDEVEALVRAFRAAGAVDTAFDGAAPPPAGARDALGLPAQWLESIPCHEGPNPLTIDLMSGTEGGERITFQPSVSGGIVPDAGEGAAVEAGAAANEGAATNESSAVSESAEDLLFFNGYGGFSADGREYVIRLPAGLDGPRRPPLPWTNVIANEQVGFVVSESGAGHTWSANSRENRLTPWSNDPVSDPHGEALYIRDEERGTFWSPTPGPTPGAGDYEVRHGFGYTHFRHEGAGLAQEVWHFVPRHDPVKIVRIRLTNRSAEPRRLSIFSYAQWVLGALPQETRATIITRSDTVRTDAAEAATGPASTARIDAGGILILATNPERGEFSDRVAFAAATGPELAGASLTADRAAFLGCCGSMAAPAALSSAAPLDGRTGTGLDPCAAFQLPLQLGPGESAECVFLLGEAEDEETARALAHRYLAPTVAATALDEVVAFWERTVSGVQIETPAPELDLMVNGWLTYQNLSCRLWGRTAFYQSGGAYGYRDQLQDVTGLVYLLPELTREQIVLHAAHQFVEGDVLHWWHPPLSKGIRTRFADDLLWLPYVTAFYLAKTGDATVLDEEARFLTARPLEPGEDEAFLLPSDSGERASVYEHCCRALDRSLTRGANGLPLIGTGDWNDGMNRVGREGRGESVWLGFFLFQILSDFIPICEARGDVARASRYRDHQGHLARALNNAGWDGAWYRRAYYDNGEPIGSATSDECRIDTIAQAWAVLSGAAPADRAEQALDAMEAHLVSEEEGLIRLLTPAFDRTPHDPGYIRGYLPGVRENGGQYTHAALWAVRALAETGRSERAAPLLKMLSPVSHGRTPDEVAVYQAEPYVIAADVYGVAPHVGRGGWTWYTGSAGWMFRVALESILGFDLRAGRTLALRPCLPDAWPGFTLRYRLPGGDTVYEIVVERGEGASRATTAAWLDDVPLAVESGTVLVPLTADGAVHRVRVRLGDDAGRRYAPRPSAAPLELTTSA